MFTETENPPYFYFWCSSPTDLESESHVYPLVMKVSTSLKMIGYDHPLPSYSFIAADTFCDLVTVTFDFFTFDILTLVSSHTRWVTWSTLPPSLKILRLSVLE